MDARTKKLKRFYRIAAADAQALVDAGLDTPRKIKSVTKTAIGKLKMSKSARDRVKARK